VSTREPYVHLAIARDASSKGIRSKERRGDKPVVIPGNPPRSRSRSRFDFDRDFEGRINARSVTAVIYGVIKIHAYRRGWLEGWSDWRDRSIAIGKALPPVFASCGSAFAGEHERVRDREIETSRRDGDSLASTLRLHGGTNGDRLVLPRKWLPRLFQRIARSSDFFFSRSPSSIATLATDSRDRQARTTSLIKV